MFRTAEIQEKLLHLIGWQQGYEGEEARVSSDLAQSESGLYFQQAHPLLTLQNLGCIAPFSLTDEQFSAWLENKTRGSIQKAISRFCNEKLIKGTYKSLCENKTLFDGTGRIVDLVKNKNNLVGFEIVPVRAKGIITKINRIGLQFTQPGEYTLYLMHSSQDIPIEAITLTRSTKNSMEWFPVNWELPYQSDKIDAGGSWYLVYFQSSLPEESQAIRKDRDWSKGPCSSCSRNEAISWKAWSRFLEIHPFSVNEELVDQAILDGDFVEDSDKSPIRLWDIENNMYDYTTNYGINLDITIECDYTDFIVEQRRLFQDIILKQVAVDFLREFIYNANVRTNRNSINASKMDIITALEGGIDDSGIARTGLSVELEKAYKAISLSTEGIDRVCQPCVNHGIRYRSV